MFFSKASFSSKYAKRLPWITTPALTILIVLVWDSYTRFSAVSPLILPTPAMVAKAWIDLVQSPRAWQDTLVTTQETLFGFMWGALFGIGFGVLLGRMKWVEQTLNPFIIALQVMPKVALVPLFVVWFGFGQTSKVLVAAVLAFFPVLTNTVLGVKSVETGHRDVMTTLNAKPLTVFWRLELPSSLPFILTGFEVGIVLSLIGAIVGEYLGGASGLGFQLTSRMNAFETDGLFAVMIQMTLLGFVFYFGVVALRRLLISWHQSVGPRSGI